MMVMLLDKMTRPLGILTVLLLMLVPATFVSAEAIENLAPKAKITADSEINKQYLARFVADGVVPDLNGKGDSGKAWAVQGATHGQKSRITFTWEAPVTVAEVVYYGRTAWYDTECWKTAEVFTTDPSKPLLKAAIAKKHGPQRITLAAPVQTKSLTLQFTASYGGPNPGASEIQIFSTPTSDKTLADFMDEQKHRSDPYYSKDLAIAKHPESQKLQQDLLAGKLGFEKLAVIQRHALTPTHVYTYHVEGLQPGGGLFTLTPTADGPKLDKLIDSSKGEILDCEISFDGKQILFSWKKTFDETFHIYRIDANGENLTQLTSGDTNNVNPCFLPDGGIAYLCDKKPAFAYCWTSTTPILHRMEADGQNPRRLSGNYLNDFTPGVLNDGSIIYSRWEYVDRPAIPIQSLWTINPDGTTLAAYYGNRVLSPATFMEARAIPGSTSVLCVLTSHNGPCCGAIGIIDRTRGINAQEAIRNLTPEINIGQVDKGNGNNVRGPYENPWPIDAEHFLVSRAGTVLLRDMDGLAQTTLVRPRDGMGFYSPRPLASRFTPPIRRSVLPEQPKGEWATIFLRNVYVGLESYVKEGEIKEIRVVQEIEKSKFADTKYRAFGFQFPIVSCGATYAPKRVWGHAKVYPDGSAHFKVPSGVPIYFMALDSRGRAVQRMRSFTHLMPGEVQGCVGCHEPRMDAAPLNVRSLAAKQPPQDLTPPEWEKDNPEGMGFSYARVVQPVLNKHCTGCHNATAPPEGLDFTGDLTDFFSVSYENLARRNSLSATLSTDPRRIPAGEPEPYTKWISTYNGSEANILTIEPKAWGSYASTLANLMVSGHPDRLGRPQVYLTNAERARIFAWIDLNVPYYGSSVSNHYDRKGCRQMMPANLESTLAEVAARRCASCHTPEKPFPREFFVRVENPEMNAFLRAPLSFTANGSQACGTATFKSADDPDYQKILSTFTPVHALLKKTPRLDMPGGEQALLECVDTALSASK